MWYSEVVKTTSLALQAAAAGEPVPELLEPLEAVPAGGIKRRYLQGASSWGRSDEHDEGPAALGIRLQGIQPFG